MAGTARGRFRRATCPWWAWSSWRERRGVRYVPVAGACIYEYTLHLYSYCRKFIRRFIRQRCTYRLDKTGIPVPGLHMGTRIIQPIQSGTG